METYNKFKSKYLHTIKLTIHKHQRSYENHCEQGGFKQVFDCEQRGIPP